MKNLLVAILGIVLIGCAGPGYDVGLYDPNGARQYIERYESPKRYRRPPPAIYYPPVVVIPEESHHHRDAGHSFIHKHRYGHQTHTH